MTAAELRTLAQVHGALAWAAVLVVLGALLVAWKRRQALLVTGSLGAALSAAAFVTGGMLHGPFQSKLRQKLFLASSTLGWLFERKEHVAFGAVALAGCAVLALVAERFAARESEGVRAGLRRAGVAALVATLVFEGFALGVSLAAKGRVGF